MFFLPRKVKCCCLSLKTTYSTIMKLFFKGRKAQFHDQQINSSSTTANQIQCTRTPALNFSSTTIFINQHNYGHKTRTHCHPLHLWHALSPKVEGTTTTSKGTTQTIHSPQNISQLLFYLLCFSLRWTLFIYILTQHFLLDRQPPST